MTLFTIDGHKYTVYETEDNDFTIMEIVPEGKQTPEAIVAYHTVPERVAHYYVATSRYKRRYKEYVGAYVRLRDDYKKTVKARV